MWFRAGTRPSDCRSCDRACGRRRRSLRAISQNIRALPWPHFWWLGLASLCLAAPGCDGGAGGTPAGVTLLRVWAHNGRSAERAAIAANVAAFSRENPDLRIELTFLPDASYNAQVQASALAGELPDILEFDGPFVYSYVWQGHLQPVDELIPWELRANIIPSIIAQGTYRGRLYSVGLFDSGLALYGRRSLLAAAGARIPDGPASAWTVAEFERVLAALAQSDPDGQVLDLKLNYTGEWFTYGFAPLLWSAGAGLIDRTDFQRASGTLNSPAAATALAHLQNWLRDDGCVDPNLDDDAFTGGRVALSWVGHWEYERYRARFGDDLVLIPLPDFGEGARTGQGSWNWGITRRCRNPRAAMRFIEFLMRDEQILAMTAANGAVPATRSALQKSERFGPGGPLRLYAAQLTDACAVPRPPTPAYPVITSVFQRAFEDIRHGADVQTVLDQAAREIDRDIRDNHGYRRPSEPGLKEDPPR